MAKGLLNVLGAFKAFALRSNVVDTAVGFVIATEFTTLVSSFVTNILMPPIGALTGGIDFSDIVIPLLPATAESAGVSIHIGAFLNAAIAFLIAAWAVFVLIKATNMLKEKEAARPSGDSREVVLLQEIRDLLAKRSS